MWKKKPLTRYYCRVEGCDQNKVHHGRKAIDAHHKEAHSRKAISAACREAIATYNEAERLRNQAYKLEARLQGLVQRLDEKEFHYYATHTK